MNLEEILQKAQQKALRKGQKIVNQITKSLHTVDEISPEEISEKFANVLNKVPSKTSEQPETARRLSLDDVKVAYQKSGLKPAETYYWFADDFVKNPLIQGNPLSLDRLSGTPIAALCVQYRNEILAGTKIVPDYIRENSKFVEGPSNKWYLGPISQLSGLSCSYILGFEIGFDNRKKPHPNCSQEVMHGYEDGQVVRKKFIDEQLLGASADLFENEIDNQKLSELYRIGYYEELNDNND